MYCVEYWGITFWPSLYVLRVVHSVVQCAWMLTGGRYEMTSEGLIIKNVIPDDSGVYTCRAEVEADGRYDERRITVAVDSK